MDSNAAAKKASAAFRKNGQLMSFVQKIEGSSADPMTGLPISAEIETPFYGMWNAINIMEIGGLIQKEDRIILAGGRDIPQPDITDHIEVDGATWNIVSIERVQTGPQAIIYKMYVRFAGEDE